MLTFHYGEASSGRNPHGGHPSRSPLFYQEWSEQQTVSLELGLVGDGVGGWLLVLSLILSDFLFNTFSVL